MALATVDTGQKMTVVARCILDKLDVVSRESTPEQAHGRNNWLPVADVCIAVGYEAPWPGDPQKWHQSVVVASTELNPKKQGDPPRCVIGDDLAEFVPEPE